MRWLLLSRLLLLAVLGLSTVSPVHGHAFAPSLLELQERGNGVVEVRFKQPKVRRSGSELRPLLPESCVVATPAVVVAEGTGLVAQWALQCEAEPGRGLVGQTVAVQGIAGSQADVLLRLRLADGRAFHRLLSADRPSFVVPEKAGPWKVAQTYAVIGVEHILLGWDHLLFVLGLVLLVPADRRLLWTVTAFTAGHSVTLALAALGLVHLPTRPIETLIALSLFVLALELTRGRVGVQRRDGAHAGAAAEQSWLSRYPWRMAAAFGLLHGLGFAAALSEIGLPQGEIPAALLAFNLGIEAGQLTFIAALLVFAKALRSLGDRVLPGLTGADLPRAWAMAGAYGIGCLSAFWVFERLFS